MARKVISYSDKWLVNPNILSEPIKPGYLVKISNGKERFNVEVKYVVGQHFIGYVMNNLLFDTFYKYHDLVTFERKNAFMILNHDQKLEELEKASIIFSPLINNYILNYKLDNGAFPKAKEVRKYFERQVNVRRIPY